MTDLTRGDQQILLMVIWLVLTIAESEEIIYIYVFGLLSGGSIGVIIKRIEAVISFKEEHEGLLKLHVCWGEV